MKKIGLVYQQLTGQPNFFPTIHFQFTIHSQLQFTCTWSGPLYEGWDKWDQNRFQWPFHSLVRWPKPDAVLVTLSSSSDSARTRWFLAGLDPSLMASVGILQKNFPQKTRLVKWTETQLKISRISHNIFFTKNFAWLNWCYIFNPLCNEPDLLNLRNGSDTAQKVIRIFIIRF